MSYIDLQMHRSLNALPPLFGENELMVIALARREQAASARLPGPLRRLLGRLFSLPPANRLANPRLEALRRLVVTARREGRPAAERLLPDFYTRGFSADQGTAILAEAERP